MRGGRRQGGSLRRKVLEETLDVAPEERQRFLRKACGGDEELRIEVTRLVHLAEAREGLGFRRLIRACVEQVRREASLRRANRRRFLEEREEGCDDGFDRTT